MEDDDGEGHEGRGHAGHGHGGAAGVVLVAGGGEHGDEQRQSGRGATQLLE